MVYQLRQVIVNANIWVCQKPSKYNIKRGLFLFMKQISLYTRKEVLGYFCLEVALHSAIVCNFSYYYYESL